MAEQLGVLEIALGVDLGELIAGMSKAQQVVAGFTAGVTELAKKAIEAASEAQAAAAQVAGVFGKLAPEVNEFSEQFGRAAGRAGSDIQAMVARFGGMIAPMLKNKETAAQMSEGLTEMAVNLSKAAHISADEAMGALQGGLSGHGRALSMLGISMNEAALKAQAMNDKLGDYSKLSQAQKEMVAYQVIMQQQAQVSARAASADQTYDEQLQQVNAHVKQAAEAFGSDLLPYATSVLGIFSQLTEAFSNLSPKTRQLIEAIAAMAVVITGAATASALFKTELGEAIAESLVAFGEAALAALPVVLAIGAIVLAIGAMKVAWDKDLGGIREIVASVAEFFRKAFAEAIQWVTKEINALWEDVAKVFKWIGDTMNAGWATSISASMGGTTGMGALASVGDSIKSGGAAAAEALKSSWGGFEDLLKGFMGMVGGGKDKAAAPKIAGLSHSQLAGEAGGSKYNIDMEVWDSLTQAMVKLTQAQVDSYNQGMEELQKQADARKAAMDASITAEEKWRDEVEQAAEDAKKAFDDAQAAATQSITSSILSGAGQLGSTIQTAMKAGAAGGPVGAAVAVGMNLLTQSQGGQEAMNVINTIMSQVANTLGQLMQGVLPILGSIQNILSPVLSAVANVFTALAPVFTMVGHVVQELMPIFQAIGVIFNALASVLKIISSVLQTVLAPIFAALAPIFMIIGQALQAIAAPLQLLGMLFQALQPVFQLVALVLQGVGIVIAGIMLGLADAWNWVAEAINTVVNGVVSAINWFIKGINSALGWAGVNIAELNSVSATANTIDTSGLQAALAAMVSGSYNAADSAGAMAAAADQATASLTNLPSGYKIALTEFQNMNTTSAGGQTGALSSFGGITNSTGATTAVPTFASGGYVTKPTLAIIGEAGPEMVVPLNGATTSQGSPLPTGGGGGGGEAPMIFNVTIVSNDPDTIWTKLQGTIKRASMARVGRPIPGVTRFALPSDTR